MAWKDMSDKWPLLDIVRHLNTNIRELFDRRVKQASGAKTAGNFVSWFKTANGEMEIGDSGSKADDFATAAHSHAGMIAGTPGTPGRLVSWDADGNVGDAGKTISDFYPASNIAYSADGASDGGAVSGSTTAGTPTYNSRRGYKTKNGRLVHFDFFINLASLSGSAGDLQISLPVPVTTYNNYKAYGVINSNGMTFPTGATGLVLEASAGATHMVVKGVKNGAASVNVPSSTIASGGVYYGSITYLTD